MDDKKIPDFFKDRAQIQPDTEDNTEKKLPELDASSLSEDLDDVPYDFRAEYKERIERTFETDEENDRKFSSVKLHAIGIGVLIGVLIALLFSVFLFGKNDDDLNDAIIVEESPRPVKVRPTNPGGMEIPDQDKTIYKRLQSDKMDEPVLERLNLNEEEPVRPQVPTKEGQILGTPRVMPETSEEIELEVLSVQKKAVEAPVSKKPVVAAEKTEEKQVVTEPKIDVKEVASKKENAKPVAKKVKKDTWKVQLISLPSKAGAEKAWPKILKANATLLSGLEHDIAEVQIKGKGTFYRLRVGSFENRKDAQDLCNKLKSRKQDCTLTK